MLILTETVLKVNSDDIKQEAAKESDATEHADKACITLDLREENI
jgi:hypothetical protein